jgi:hypothetical protein
VNQRLRESLAAPADLGRAPPSLSLSLSRLANVEGRGKGLISRAGLRRQTSVSRVAVAFSLLGPLAVAFLGRARPGGSGRGVDSSMASPGPHALRRPLAHCMHVVGGMTLAGPLSAHRATKRGRERRVPGGSTQCIVIIKINKLDQKCFATGSRGEARARSRGAQAVKPFSVGGLMNTCRHAHRVM